MKFDLPSNMGAHGRLWLAVLQQAVSDYGDVREHASASRWFHSDRNGVGSFRWICSLFGLNPDKAFRHITGRA
jgi:hypothetical protein